MALHIFSTACTSVPLVATMRSQIGSTASAQAQIGFSIGSLLAFAVSIAANPWLKRYPARCLGASQLGLAVCSILITFGCQFKSCMLLKSALFASGIFQGIAMANVYTFAMSYGQRFLKIRCCGSGAFVLAMLILFAMGPVGIDLGANCFTGSIGFLGCLMLNRHLSFGCQQDHSVQVRSNPRSIALAIVSLGLISIVCSSNDFTTYTIISSVVPNHVALLMSLPVILEIGLLLFVRDQAHERFVLYLTPMCWTIFGICLVYTKEFPALTMGVVLIATNCPFAMITGKVIGKGTLAQGAVIFVQSSAAITAQWLIDWQSCCGIELSQTWVVGTCIALAAMATSTCLAWSIQAEVEMDSKNNENGDAENA